MKTNSLLQTFPTQAHYSRSNKYTFIDSRKLIEMLQERGFELHSIKRGKRGKESIYGRHIVTMKNSAFPKIEGDGEFTLTFINSFDGSSRFKMMVGYFRIICENGMIIMENGESTKAIKHINRTAEDIYQEAMEIVAKAVEAEKKVRRAKEINVIDNNLTEQLVSELLPLVQERVKGTVLTTSLFEVKREEDAKSDLWTVLNVAQENLLRGMRVEVRNEKGFLRSRKLRSVENNPKQVEKVNTVIAQLLNRLTA